MSRLACSIPVVVSCRICGMGRNRFFDFSSGRISMCSRPVSGAIGGAEISLRSGCVE
ncbi:MAG: hypothetical protein AB2728_16830 [Candidatus Thiodiazotropha sp.]|nr:hypothetical protein [Candidatus Thiodiazotropha taylori]MBT3058981.1 hypothetical protein [Candidatus Thiodiazotropha sp. (ex Lucina pensylvanica)]MBT3063845.1 hypothetical protein [Candidatus Thiodiazotropha sp. (ex Lucina pensylvanica)]MBV2095804.1 hypothetical protein [Candidatus Thiodiazotropha sp. (ex Codakia orbicularis)]